MMLPTHIVIGILISVPLLNTLPDELKPIVLGAVIIGSIIPDLDLIIGTHRKTFHYPFLSWVPTILFGVLTLLSPHNFLLALFALFLGIAQHSTSDILGGGIERKPWNKISEKAVYNHITHSWIPPKHIIPYDGAPTDLALYLSSGVFIYPLFQTNTIHSFLFITLTSIAVIYTTTRKTLPTIEDYLYQKTTIARKVLELSIGSPEERE